MLVLTPRSGSADDDAGFKMGAGVCEYSVEADVEGVGFVEGVSGPLVAASTSVLRDGSCALIVGVAEGRVDDGSILEEWTDVVSISVLCEGSCALNEWVVEDRLVDDSMLENLGDVARVDIDVVLAPDKIDERNVDDDSLLEDTEALASDDTKLELFSAGEERIEDN